MLTKIIKILDKIFDIDNKKKASFGPTHTVQKPTPQHIDRSENANIKPTTIWPQKDKQYKDTEIEKPYIEFVRPFEEEFKLLNALEGIIKLLKFLEKYGSCPSVKTKSKFSSNFNVLFRVTLKEHSYRTTRIMMKILNDKIEKKDPILIPSYIIASLGHDIGKIIIYNKKRNYVKADHPILSVKIIRRYFSHCNTLMLKKIEKAILNHHRESEDDFDRLIRYADKLARTEELIIF